MNEENKKEIPQEEPTPVVNETKVLEAEPVTQKTEEKPKDRKGLAIASMVLGIVSIVFFCTWYISAPCAVLAIIFAILSLKSTKRGMAIAGLTTGIIGFILMVILYIFVFVMGVGIMQQAFDTIEDMENSPEYNKYKYNYNYHYDI